MNFYKIFLIHENFFGRPLHQTLYVSASDAQRAVNCARLEYPAPDKAYIYEVLEFYNDKWHYSPEWE